jgi:hypothetical protein
MKYSRNPRVRYQRNILLSTYISLDDLLSLGSHQHLEIYPVGVLSRMGVLFELNLTSALIWEFLTDKKSHDEIVEYISKIFDVESEVLNQDITEIFDQLMQHGLCICYE